MTGEEFNELLREAPAPTADDVSITTDGQRLDTKEKVLSFCAELAAERGVALEIDAAAGLLGMAPTHLARVCDEGRVECVTVGGHTLIAFDELHRILAERARASERLTRAPSAGGTGG
jgi:hypothetical protein